MAPLLFGSALLGNRVNPTGKIAIAPQALPSQFSVRHVALSFTHRFNVQDDTNPNLGRVDESFFARGRIFEIYNSSGDRTSVSRQRHVSWGKTIDIFEGDDTTKIGTLNEDVSGSLFKVYTVYRILGPNGDLLAHSEKIDAWNTDFELYDSANRIVLSMHRPWWNWLNDVWTVTIHGDSIDPRLAEVVVSSKSASSSD